MTQVDAGHSELLDVEGHICAFFHSVEEEYEVLLPVLKQGFDRGERIFYRVDPNRRDDHLARLSAAGFDVAGGEARGQLVLRDWSETHLATGSLDQDAFMAQFASERDEGRSRGYPRTWFVSHMEWGLKGSRVQFDAYEMGSNFVPIKPDVGLCTYQLEHWGGTLLVSALRSHPLVILGGLLHENPFYVPPQPPAPPS